MVRLANDKVFVVFGVYLPPRFGERLQSLYKLEALVSRVEGPVMLIGDFNAMLNSRNNSGSALLPASCLSFNRFVYACRLKEVEDSNKSITAGVEGLGPIWRGWSASTWLVGTIPASVARLRNLTYLSLNHNGLTGAIPSGLGRRPLIHDLDLCYNRLSGQVPFWKEVVEWLGPKLKLAGNDGLCLGSEIVGTGLVRVDVDGCISDNVAQSLARDGSAVSSSGSSLRLDSWYGVAPSLLPANLLTL
ncbi:phytosulfokine receptor 1 [Nymphaea colorata]|nr:phytosulfokine receptor 1 [Nymphaea colorata]